MGSKWDIVEANERKLRLSDGKVTSAVFHAFSLQDPDLLPSPPPNHQEWTMISFAV